MVNELTDTSDSFVLLYRLPKVISEMVGQTCRFAATTRRSSPTISEISFRNHSMPKNVRSLRKFRARQRLGVAQVSKPAVSPISKSAGRANAPGCPVFITPQQAH